MSTAISNIQSRLPMPSGLIDMDAGKWRVLCESIFPTAKTPEAIVLAVDYCKARKLDIMKKPVHIVPMWSSSLKREVETVWPGINEVQITASRTGKYAGMDEPKWGNDITRTFKGTKGNNVGETEITLTFPESCSVRVYRIVDGQRCAFTEPVFWLECYARIGKSELPNDQWVKRTRGQFLKVAKAFSLRAAFPEEGLPTAEEMEGKVLEDVVSDGVTIEHVASARPTTGEASAKQVFGSAKAMKERWTAIRDALLACKAHTELEKVFIDAKVDFASFKSVDEQLYDSLVQISQQRRDAINAVISEAEDATFDEEEAPPFLKQQIQEANERAAAAGLQY